MHTYEVDDELAALVERTAKAKPFENLSFNEALWRVMRSHVLGNDVIENLDEEMEKWEATKASTSKPNEGETGDLSQLLRKDAPRILRDPFAGQTLDPPKVRIAADTTFADLDKFFADVLARQPKKAPSPSARSWASSVPTLKDKKGLSDWKDICDLLEIDPAGDSARRSLQRWVKANRPNWPPVPNP